MDKLGLSFIYSFLAHLARQNIAVCFTALSAFQTACLTLCVSGFIGYNERENSSYRLTLHVYLLYVFFLSTLAILFARIVILISMFVLTAIVCFERVCFVIRCKQATF